VGDAHFPLQDQLALYKTELEKRKADGERLAAELSESQRAAERLSEQASTMTAQMAELKQVRAGPCRPQRPGLTGVRAGSGRGD
jgi:hypothetical protein